MKLHDVKQLGRSLAVALALLIALAPAAMAAPAAQDGDPTPILLGEMGSASLLAGESASFSVQTPDSGIYVLTTGNDDATAANFTVSVVDEDGNEVFNDLLQTVELELEELEYIITATAAADGDVTVFLTGALGELSDDWGEGELVNGGFVTEEDIDGTRYAEVEIEDSDYWQRALVVITGGEDDIYSAYISGEDAYESIYDHIDEGPLVFWTQGGDYTLEITPAEESGESLTVVLLLEGPPTLVNVDEETEVVMQPGTRTAAASFMIEEANRAYTVTLNGDDELDVDASVSIEPTQETWSSYNSGTDETITFVAPVAGQYFVNMWTSSLIDEPFPMTLLVEAGDEAAFLEAGTPLWGEVEEGGKAVYSLNVEQENTLLTIFMAASNEQDLDLSAQQVDETGSSVASYSTYTSGSTEVLAATIAEPGVFQVTVSGAYADDDVPFVLLARLDSPGDVGAQWAVAAEASSQAGDPDFAAAAAAGAPDAPMGAESVAAWSALDADAGEETLTVTFEHLVVPTGVRIYESQGAGAVVRIEAFDSDEEEWVLLWEGSEPTEELARVFSPELEEEEILTDQLRLTLDTASVAGANQIDAVQLLGVP